MYGAHGPAAATIKRTGPYRTLSCRVIGRRARLNLDVPFHLDLPSGAMSMPLRVRAVDWWQNRILSVGNNSSPVLSHLRTKVHKILIFGQCRGSLVLSNALALLPMLCFVPNIIAMKSRGRRKKNKCRSFFWVMTPSFIWHVVGAIYCPSCVKLCPSSVCWSPSAKPVNVVEWRIYVGWVQF